MKLYNQSLHLNVMIDPHRVCDEGRNGNFPEPYFTFENLKLRKDIFEDETLV